MINTDPKNDYEKTFDSVQTQAVLTSLQEQQIEDMYVELPVDKYTNTSMKIPIHSLHIESNKINSGRGVRYRETTSPKLFTAHLKAYSED